MTDPKHTLTKTQTRKLTDEEKLVMEYVRQNKNENTESVVNYFCGHDEIERRVIFSNAVEWLVWNEKLDRNHLSALSVRIGE